MGAIVYRRSARKLSKRREAIGYTRKRRGFEWLSHSSNRKLETGKEAAAAKAEAVHPMAIAGKAAEESAATIAAGAGSEAGLKARLKSTWTN
jgi:hypothetical protein